jgi:6-phosphogluconate dehydrogenase
MKSQYNIGIIGLGVMGHNLMLNIADHGYSVAGYDNDTAKVENLRKGSTGNQIFYSSQLKEFIDSLEKPRSIILLVPAGAPVDSVIESLSPHLDNNDLIIDLGNSYFKDTDLRLKGLNEKGILFMGIGISGGEEGARRGASIMPGGPKEAFDRIGAILEAASAKIDNVPCVAYLGPGSSGHFVKMVHNGIEYGIMQLISETYAFMKIVLGFSDDKLMKVYSEWDKSELNSFLIEITGRIFARLDDKTGKRLVDEILDVSRQKGTGMWTSQSAMELQVPIPTIDIAVSMRNLSTFEEERQSAGEIYSTKTFPLTEDPDKILLQLKKSLYVSMILTYAQGFALLSKASEKYKYRLDLKTISRIWRGGCIIRAALLEDIMEAFQKKNDLSNLLFDEKLSVKIMNNQENLRQIVSVASSMGVAVPGLMSALAYFDSFRSSWLPANLIQAQRDYFGGHTYERKDAKGTYHTEWLNTVE